MDLQFLLLDTVLTIENLMALGGFGTFITIIIAINVNLNRKFAKKADKEATENRFLIMHEHINSKVDKTAFDIMYDDVKYIRGHVDNLKNDKEN